jgi:hypothetical protein
MSMEVSALPSHDQTHRELVYRPFQFHKRSQYFFGAHDVTLAVAAMCVNNPGHYCVLTAMAAVREAAGTVE